MGFSTFVGNHPLLVLVIIIGLFVFWRFGIQPRLGMTNKEIQDKVEGTMKSVEESLTVEPQDILDQSSLPKFAQVHSS